MEHPKDIGDHTTLAVILALRRAGYAIFMPFGENTRADLVIDDGENLARVQCKTGRLRQGAVRFRVCSAYAHHPHPKVIGRHYLDDVQFFAVHCPETSGVYLVPIGELPLRNQAALRIEAPRNNRRKGIRDAARYEIGRVESKPPGSPALTLAY